MENRRVRMTKRMIQEAVLELLETTGPEKLTVTDVCQRADVNRSTFYAYYTEIRDVIREIEDDLLQRLPEPPPAQVPDRQFQEALTAFCDYVQRNERLFRILIVQRDSRRFNQRLVDAVMERYARPAAGPAGLRDRYAYVYCVSGVIGVMREWIEGRFPMASAEFAALLLKMSAGATAG